MKLKRLAESLVKKYRTRDPFQIADALGYIVLRVPLKGICGYYRHMKRRTIIYIDSGLDWWEEGFVCAHEIGHALLHRGCNRIFMDTNTYFKVDEYEIEADKFALNLLYSDSEVACFFCMPASVFADAAGVSTELAEYRMDIVDLSTCEYPEAEPIVFTEKERRNPCRLFHTTHFPPKH